MDAPPTPRLFPNLPDCASEQDDRALAIDKVGIKDLSYPIDVRDRAQGVQHTVAQVSLYVGLPHQFKGTHMSRFVEVLNAVRGEMTIRNLPGVLTEIQRRLGAEDAHIELAFPYFISKKAPVSGAESLMEYRCSFEASRKGAFTHFVLGVRVPVTSLCPCSKSISERGAHNQRSVVDVEVQADDFVWIEDIVEIVESCASAPLYALLKREDEKHLTELAYDHPRFVEDLVREAVLALRSRLKGLRWLRVRAENQESIHNHSAYAEIAWSLEEEEARRQVPLEFPRAKHEEPMGFGEWLRRQRAARQFSQQEVAERMGISPSYMSRVEKGEKLLSESALARLADLLGLDPQVVMLRAGLVPTELLARISSRPEEFLAWAADRA